jgi:hypothetical protein
MLADSTSGRRSLRLSGRPAHRSSRPGLGKSGPERRCLTLACPDAPWPQGHIPAGRHPSSRWARPPLPRPVWSPASQVADVGEDAGFHRAGGQVLDQTEPATRASIDSNNGRHPFASAPERLVELRSRQRCQLQSAARRRLPRDCRVIPLEWGMLSCSSPATSRPGPSGSRGPKPHADLPARMERPDPRPERAGP